MGKVEINVDTVKDILITIIKTADVPLENGETLMRMSNLEDESFYTRKHRLESAENYLKSLQDSIHKGYCLVDLLTLDRVYNIKSDIVAVQAKLSFWVQTEALPSLERLINRANLLSFGERYKIPPGILRDVDGNEANRSASVLFKSLSVDKLDPTSTIGEAVFCSVNCGIDITEDLAIDSDTKLDITLKVNDEDTEPTLFKNIFTTEKNIAHTSNTRPLTQANLQTLGVSKTTKILAVSFSTYCSVNNYGKALERLIAAYSTKNKKTLNELINIKATLPNGHIIEENMVCTDAKIAASQIGFVIMSFIFSPKAKGVSGESS